MAHLLASLAIVGKGKGADLWPACSHMWACAPSYAHAEMCCVRYIILQMFFLSVLSFYVFIILSIIYIHLTITSPFIHSLSSINLLSVSHLCICHLAGYFSAYP